jgi:hypothetical protein
LTSDFPSNTCVSYVDTGEAIKQVNNAGYGVVHTTQVYYANTARYQEGFRIIVDFGENNSTEIILGDKNERTSRQIRIEYNLPNLILSGEFGSVGL